MGLDISRSDATKYIEKLERICRYQERNYHKGLGYIGIRRKNISNSTYFMPANVVIYDRNARFNKHKMSFSNETTTRWEIFDLMIEILRNCLSVITRMFPNPPAGSGPAGQNSPCVARLHPEEAKTIPIMG